MKRSLFIALSLAGFATAEPPKESAAKAAWLWQSVECQNGVCLVRPKGKSAQAAWLWSQTESYEGCDCSKPCACCEKGTCSCKNGECHQKEQYGQLRDRAVKEGKSLIVGVGCEPPQVSGYLSVRYDAFPGVKGPKVVLGAYRNKELWQQDWNPVLPKPTTH